MLEARMPTIEHWHAIFFQPRDWMFKRFHKSPWFRKIMLRSSPEKPKKSKRLIGSDTDSDVRWRSWSSIRLLKSSENNTYSLTKLLFRRHIIATAPHH